MKVFLLTIGDELLIGQTVNTNAAWVGEQLSLLGAEVVGSTTVGDEARAIRQALEHGFAEADLVVTTGGLGPTHDDITRQVVADVVGVPLEVDAALMGRIEDYYEGSGRAVPDAVRSLAEVPRGFEVLANPAGTAPGLWHRDEASGRTLVVLPGVPQEMKGLMHEHVLPRLQRRDDLQTTTHRTILTTGVTESSLQERIQDVVQRLGEEVWLAYLPSTSGVRLRITARGETRAAAEEKLDATEQALRERIDRYIFGTGKETLEGVVARLFTERGLTVAAAESCTGGYLMHRLTYEGGASAFVRGGVVAYCNTVKEELLGVDVAMLADDGAVSEAVARQMAEGVRGRLDADVGVSTTGIAGPTGGTPDKPVGLVWIGYADALGSHAFSFRFTHDRQLNKELASTAALETLRRRLLDPEATGAPWPSRAQPAGAS